MRIAVAGATGYIGGRLVPQLIANGHDVVCLARRPAKLNGRPWRADVTVRGADVLDEEATAAALDGCDVAFYLVHAMGDDGDFADVDRRAARSFSAAAAAAGIGRIVYLGGLGGEEDELSKHLASRQEVGEILRSGPTPVSELRAAVIIGSGSVSFEMLRYLTEVLPVMVTPTWVDTRCQPIAVRDVLGHLVAAAAEADGANHIHEIGGPDILTYREMMRIYAEEAGLPRRLIIPVPVLSPGLSSRWIGLVTPLPSGVARPLVDSLRNEVVVHEPSENRHAVEPTPFRTAVRRALDRSEALDVETRWSDASSSPARPFAGDPEWAGGTLFTDAQEVETWAEPDALYRAFARIGGDVGYYVHNWAWRIRGVLDAVVGGVGLRRGRRHPTDVRLHDTIDFWRVAAIEPGEMLQLSAEMKLPGDAWLEWRVEERGDGTVLRQTAYFRPRGLTGRLYWYAMLPAHHLIFRSMAEAITKHAEATSPTGEVASAE
jgi:uncharacterized protein YbjT (DUF2867 family)